MQDCRFSNPLSHLSQQQLLKPSHRLLPAFLPLFSFHSHSPSPPQKRLLQPIILLRAELLTALVSRARWCLPNALLSRMPPLHRLGNRCHLFEVKIPLILATLSRSLRSELMLFVLPSARTPRQQAQGSDSQGCGITNLSGCSFHSSAIKAEHLSRTGLSCRDGSPSFSWGCHIAAAQLSRQGITCTVPCQDTADATQHSSHCTEAFCPWEQSLAQLTASSCIQTCWVRGSLRGWGAAKVESRKKEIGCIQKAPRG